MFMNPLGDEGASENKNVSLLEAHSLTGNRNKPTPQHSMKSKSSQELKLGTSVLETEVGSTGGVMFMLSFKNA